MLTVLNIIYFLLLGRNFKLTAHNVKDSHLRHMLKTIFNSEFSGMCMLSLSTRFYMHNTNGSLVIAVKPKRKYTFHAVAIFLSYILPQKSKISLIFFRDQL
jgi:hypothetical protein